MNSFFEERDDFRNGVVLFAGFHCGNIRGTVFVEFHNSWNQEGGSELFFGKNLAEALIFKGCGVLNLIAAAGVCRERNQKIWLSERQKFTDGVGSGPGNTYIRKGEKVCQLFFDVLKLNITFQMIQ